MARDVTPLPINIGTGFDALRGLQTGAQLSKLLGLDTSGMPPNLGSHLAARREREDTRKFQAGEAEKQRKFQAAEAEKARQGQLTQREKEFDLQKDFVDFAQQLKEKSTPEIVTHARALTQALTEHGVDPTEAYKLTTTWLRAQATKDDALSKEVLARIGNIQADTERKQTENAYADQWEQARLTYMDNQTLDLSQRTKLVDARRRMMEAQLKEWLEGADLRSKTAQAELDKTREQVKYIDKQIKVLDDQLKQKDSAAVAFQIETLTKTMKAVVPGLMALTRELDAIEQSDLELVNMDTPEAKAQKRRNKNRRTTAVNALITLRSMLSGTSSTIKELLKIKGPEDKSKGKGEGEGEGKGIVMPGVPIPTK